MKSLFVTLAACAALAAAGGASAQAAPKSAHAGIPAYVQAAVASKDRPAPDKGRDDLRHPAELIAFAGIKPGQHVADIVPGGGYFTRIFSKVVGPKGRVFAVVPAEFLKLSANAANSTKAIAAEPAFSNVVPVTAPIAAIVKPRSLDVAWISDNYHDIYGFLGEDRAAALDAAVFKALKPGGIFIVIDHVAKPGTSAMSAHTLHRIDPETVKKQAIAAGFQLVSASPILKNTADQHELPIFSPVVRGRTDQFVLKFRKPATAPHAHAAHAAVHPA